MNSKCMHMLANEVYAHAAVSRMSWGACRCDGKGAGWEEASAYGGCRKVRGLKNDQVPKRVGLCPRW